MIFTLVLYVTIGIPFGLIYLIGFMLNLFFAKSDHKNLRIWSLLSSIICTIAIVSYIIIFIFICNRNYLEIKSYGINDSFNYTIGIGPFSSLRDLFHFNYLLFNVIF